MKESTQEMMDAAGGAAAGEDSDSSCAPKVYWNEPRHLTCGIPKPVFPAPSWKLSSVVCESPTLVFFFCLAVHGKETTNHWTHVWRKYSHTWVVCGMVSQPRVVNGILLLCLNIGVTPPDASKPKSCATLEAWVDPFAQPAKKSLEAIGLHCNTTTEHTPTHTDRQQQQQ